MRSSRWSSPEHSARRRTVALAAVLFAVYAATLGTHAVARATGSARPARMC